MRCYNITSIEILRFAQDDRVWIERLLHYDLSRE